MPEHSYRAVMMTLAQRVRHARESQGLSQEAVAHTAGISVFTYASIERVTLSSPLPDPTLRTVVSVLWVLGIDPDHEDSNV